MCQRGASNTPPHHHHPLSVTIPVLVWSNIQCALIIAEFLTFILFLTIDLFLSPQKQPFDHENFSRFFFFGWTWRHLFWDKMKENWIVWLLWLKTFIIPLLSMPNLYKGLLQILSILKNMCNSLSVCCAQAMGRLYYWGCRHGSISGDLTPQKTPALEQQSYLWQKMVSLGK